MSYVSSPFITLCILPFVATLLITAAIRFFGGHSTNDRLGSASAGVCIVWVTALVLGMPEFPPPRGGNALPVILMAGLILGSLLDQFLPVFHGRAKLWDTVLDFAFAIGAITWYRGELDLWGFLIFAGWGTLQIRTRRYKEKNTIPAVMMFLSAAGLFIIAWTGNSLSDGNLALGVFSVTLGLSVWLSFNRSFSIGYGYLWGGFTAQLLIAFRIIEANPALAAPIAILGFIFLPIRPPPASPIGCQQLRKFPVPQSLGSYLSSHLPWLR